MDKEQILDNVRKIVKEYFSHQVSRHFVPGKSKIGVGSPIYNEEEVTEVLNALLETQISQGKAVRTFEGLFATYTGVQHAVAVNSGSSANLIALTTFIENGDAKPGDEIIMPAATFSTVAFPAIQVGLVPVFVDVDADSYNIDANTIEKAVSSNTRLIMPVHSLGNPADMHEIQIIAKKHGLKILEDCCEAHGASINGRKVGSFGDLATLSFYVAHNITTGEGGMIFTNDRRYEHILRSVREFGRMDQEGDRFVHVKHLGIYDKKYIFERLGYNVRMTDLQASFGIHQFRKLEQFNKKRVENVQFFIDEFRRYNHLIQLPAIRRGYQHTFYAFPIIVRNGAPFKRQHLIDFLEHHGIETRPFFAGCLPDQPALSGKAIRCAGELPVSRHLRDNAFFIGCHPDIGEQERQFVVDTFRSFLQRF